MKAKLVYCAGCYSAPTREQIAANVAIAEEHGKQVLLAGHIPVIPHRLTAHWEEDSRFNHFSYNDWLERFCLPLLKNCHAIYLFHGWSKSSGAAREFEFAVQHNIPIVYTIPELEMVFEERSGIMASIFDRSGSALEAR
jgi:hypothetical protein